MQKLRNTLTTTAGKELLASVDGGQDRIEYTHAVLASDNLTDASDDAIRQMKSLNILQTAPIAVASRIKTTINLAATFTNQDIKADFDFWTIGWYAKGDTTLTDEVLLAITPSTTMQTMPSSISGASTAAITPKYAMSLSEASEVIINPEQAGMLTPEAVQQMINMSINAAVGNGIIDRNVVLTETDDLNNRLTTSYATINGSVPNNAVAGASEYGQVIVYGSKDGGPVTQLYYDDATGLTSVRYYNPESKLWSDWDAILTKSQLANALPDNVADDSTVVHLANDETVTGQKKFSIDPVNKDGDAYGLAKDIAGKADAKDTVNLTGDQEVAGTKTFDTAPINKANGKPYITADDAPKVDTTKLVTTDGAAGNVQNSKVNFKAGQATIDDDPALSAVKATDKDDATAKSTAKPNALVIW